MKSLMLLWQVVADEYGNRCGTSTSRDFETLTTRVEHEGLSFLTITLPQFCKDFERSLDMGRVDRNLFQGFKWKGGLPVFLRGFLGQVFDRDGGWLVSDPSIEAIRAVRQLSLLYSKLELTTTSRRYRKAMEGFVDCEAEIRQGDSERDTDFVGEFERISLLLWADVLSRVDATIYREHLGPSPSNEGWPFIYPKHGPGATADRLCGNAKYDLAEWPERLDHVFPFVEYAVPNWRHFARQHRVDFPEPGMERPVRVVAVPKTMKSPRIIAIEPTAMQYMQQGIKDVLVPAIQADPEMGLIVGFDDQARNRALAQEGSLTGHLATLDLSEASDRVSYSLVKSLLRHFPHVAEAVDVTRSLRADVDGFGIIPLTKFASMGSALTFPIEAMVFTTVVFLGIEKSLNRRLTRFDVQSLRGQVRVYGDDIIVPVESVQSVVQALETFGFKVNRSKSFWTGMFRESCGREFYRGHDVSVVKARKVVENNGMYDFPSSIRKHAALIESFVALRNNMYISGMWQTAAWLDKRIESLFGGHYPNVEVTYLNPEEGWGSRSKLLGRWSFLGYRAERTHRSLHTPIVRGYVARSRSPESISSDVGALHKVLSLPREKPFEDPEHLLRAGRPRVVRIKLEWATPY